MNWNVVAIFSCIALSGCASMERWALSQSPPAAAPLANDPSVVDLPASAPVASAPVVASGPVPGSAPLSSPPPPPPLPSPRAAAPPLSASVPPAPPLPGPAPAPGARSAPAATPPAGVGSNPAFIEERARHAYETGRLDVAEGYYLQLMQLKPKDAGPWFQLGNLYSEQGRLDAAERAYRESLRRRDDARTLHNLGLAQVKLGIGALREAQKRLPPNDPARRETQEFLRILLESVGR